YTLAGTAPNALTMNVTTGQASINVVSGNQTVSAPVVMSKDTTITATGNVSFINSVTATGVANTKAGPGTAQFENIHAGSLNVTGRTVKISQKGSPNLLAGTSVVQNLLVSTG